jgi:thiol-disulfide isomerase/thioredoxin
MISLGAGFAVYRALHESDLSPLPEPQLVDLEGRGHSLSSEKGKVVVVNFWATWCQPCREEMKTFSALQGRLGDQGLQIIGIAIDDPEVVRAYLREYPVSYPIWIGGAETPAWADSLGNELSALPFTVVFDRSGQKRNVHVGALNEDQLLERVMPWIQSGSGL